VHLGQLVDDSPKRKQCDRSKRHRVPCLRHWFQAHDPISQRLSECTCQDAAQFFGGIFAHRNRREVPHLGHQRQNGFVGRVIARSRRRREQQRLPARIQENQRSQRHFLGGSLFP